MVTINLTNLTCSLSGDIKEVNLLKALFKVRHPGAFFVKQKMGRFDWDGKIQYIKDSGNFAAGLFPLVIKRCVENNISYKIYDRRVLPELSKKPLDPNLRDYQVSAIKSITHNQVGGVVFPRGVINAAPNAGKTYIMVGIHKSYKNSKTIVLINDADLYDQFKREIPKLLSESEVGYLRGKEYKLAPFMIVMVKTLAQNAEVYKYKLRDYNILAVDECDISDNKTYKSALSIFHNTPIVVGLSGTIFMSKLKKDEMSAMNLISLYGVETFNISGIDLVSRGVSVPVRIKFFRGNELLLKGLSFPEQYDKGITDNNDRHEVILKRVLYNLKVKRYPILIVCQYHDHIYKLHQYLVDKIPKSIKLKYVHHESKDRKLIFEKFHCGDIDILISSFIIKRGKNLPKIKVIINASGTDSAANTLQIMGRVSRTHPSKKSGWLEDFMDEGNYLKRHSKHREVFYKKDKREILRFY